HGWSGGPGAAGAGATGRLRQGGCRRGEQHRTPQGPQHDSPPAHGSSQPTPPDAAAQPPTPNLPALMALLTAMRPQEWIKNLLVFAGVLFSGRVDRSGAVGDAMLTFVAFCAISSAGYLFNDLHDVEHDRLHPE